MKNLMILACVLVLAPAASGMLTFSTPDDLGGNTVMENTSITIEVTGDIDTSDFTLQVDMAGDYSALQQGSLNAGLVGYTGDLSSSTPHLQSVAGNRGTGSDVAAGQVLYDFTLTTGSATNTITIDDWTGVLPPPLSTTHNLGAIDMTALVLTIVPEPATIVLLGLGGLLLRRRR